ncbi:Protein of unknown function [Marinobacter daqiaonensis]|uniref:DUF2782 domain-containing protein n=1 Tax=Marinobacter daqiaonensis TaxID=650891 RepID=A0A1I6JVB8_9GAMM|nr:DUF2782 domain-containing protein [Marinobacter daqiaonensis]SFR82893.1 Protein of unknown function [Marinobacter daqiaonensis]
MKLTPVFVLAAFAVLAVAPAAAQETSTSDLNEDPSTSPLDKEPRIPDEPVVLPPQDSAGVGTEIVIRPAEDKVFYEYRVNGELREIKVVPDVGPEYYLVPAEGGGWIREEETSLLIPSWVIFRW